MYVPFFSLTVQGSFCFLPGFLQKSSISPDRTLTSGAMNLCNLASTLTNHSPLIFCIFCLYVDYINLLGCNFSFYSWTVYFFIITQYLQWTIHQNVATLISVYAQILIFTLNKGLTISFQKELVGTTSSVLILINRKLLNRALALAQNPLQDKHTDFFSMSIPS